VSFVVIDGTEAGVYFSDQLNLLPVRLAEFTISLLPVLSFVAFSRLLATSAFVDS